ncbi:unnamed protein product [Alopecurus aequalis]
MSSSSNVTGAGKKISWPEVVGMSVEEAKKIIVKDKPDAIILVQPVYSPVQQDMWYSRVRIFVATISGVLTVANTPQTG